MKLSYEDHGKTTVITVSGELLADQADAFRRACQDRMAAGIRDFVLNLEYLELIDSAGLELLLWLAEQIAEQSGQLRLVNPEETVSKIFEVTRLERRFNIHDSIESAAKSLR